MKQKVVRLTRLAVLGCILVFLGGFTAFAQGGRGITVQGKVIDSEGLPVFGAGVTLKGTTTGVAADLDGNFSLNVPDEAAILEVQALGYVTEEVRVGKQRNLTVVLRDDTQSLEATVVVAYGTQTKATVTGALTAIDSKVLVKAPVADVTNVLAGQMPGVSTVQESGQPGEDYAKIYIRGVSSLSDGASSPLILVDGVERPLNTVDPNEIESLSILKDAASTAVFGVRGANGVIIVTTKRGDAGKPKISVSSITGVQVPMSYITQCSSYDFARYYNVYQQNDGKTDESLYFTREAIEAYRTGSDPIMFPNTQWHELMFRDAFLQTKNNINISGGSDKVRYFVSMGYMFQNGLLKQIPGMTYNNNYSYNRYNYRANLDFKLTETTDMKFNISGVIGDTREPLSSASGSNIWMISMLWAHPTASPGLVNGMPVTVVDSNALPDGLTKWNGWEYYYYSGYQNKYKTTLGMDMTLTQRLDFITQGLSASVKGSYDTSMAITKKRTGSGGYHQTIRYASWADDSGLAMSDPAFDRTYVPVISGSEPTLSYSESTSDDKNWYLEARIDYSRKFAGKHAVSGLLLYNQSRDGLFPSASLGWVLTEEKFMKKASWVDFLKLRASVGLVGNDQSSSVRFMYMEGVWNDTGSYYFGSGNNGSVPRYEMGTPGNAGVTWETALKYNVGLDADLLNYRLHFSGDLFKEHRTGILISPNTPPGIIATKLPNMNLGIVDNKGYEVELGWKDNIGKFTYDLSANVTFARNKIINMDEVTPEYDYQAYTGGSTGRYSLYQFVRLYQKSDFYTDANGVQRLNPDLPQPTTTVYPGDCMYDDLNGDGVIDGLDTKVDGYPDRPEYVFGSNWKFGYRGFNLTLNWIAATHVNRVFNMDYRIPFTNSGHRGLLQYFADNCWIPDDNDWAPGREDGTLPRFTKTNYPWNSMNSTLWTVDASYLRLKSANFGYTFSRNKFFDKLGISSLGIMFTGYNLLTFSRMTLQDPEAQSSDSDGQYPLVKTYNIALNISF